MRYDIAIIGTGPAGLSAAINAKIRNKNMILFGTKNLSSKLVKAPKINNYLGFYNVTGEQLKQSFEKHLDSMDIVVEEEKINEIYPMGDYFAFFVGDDCYEASAVVIATGMEYTKPIDGEEEFLGKGVGYCATCDAPLYRDKVVSIISYDKEGEQEANYVNELASKVYYIPMYKGEFSLNESIEVVCDSPIKIIGTGKAEKLVLKTREIATDGIFILKDCVSPSQLVPGLVTEGVHIKVDRNMETNYKGMFAAGDCTGKPYQFMKASGEGLVAGLSAVAYLDAKEQS